MELNREIDAIIISKIADKRQINAIQSLNLMLKSLKVIGNVSARAVAKQSPNADLIPLFMLVTLLARKANVDAGSVLDSDEYKTQPLPYNDQKIAIAQLVIGLYNLNCSACDISDFESGNLDIEKDELHQIHLQGIQATYNMLKNIEVIAEANKSNLSNVQNNVIKHLGQLVNLI